MDFNENNTELHIRMERQLTLPPGWEPSDNIQAKMNEDGTFASFMGDMLAFELTPVQKNLMEPVFATLKEFSDTFVPVSMTHLRVTLRGLANPYTVGIRDRKLIEQHLEMNRNRVTNFFNQLNSETDDFVINLSDGRFSLSEQRASGAYFFQFKDSESWEAMQTLQLLCDRADPYRKLGTDIYHPHITLCYLYPRSYSTQESIIVRNAIAQCHQTLSNLNLEFKKEDIRYYYHTSMNDFRVIR